MAAQSNEQPHGGRSAWSISVVLVLATCCCGALLATAEESMRQWCPRYHGVNAQPDDV